MRRRKNLLSHVSLRNISRTKFEFWVVAEVHHLSAVTGEWYKKIGSNSTTLTAAVVEIVGT